MAGDPTFQSKDNLAEIFIADKFFLHLLNIPISPFLAGRVFRAGVCR